MEAKRRFLSVAHLWGAYSIRGRKWQERVDLNYSFGDDVESFLAEAEILRRWGQTCIAGAARTPELQALFLQFPSPINREKNQN